MCRFGRCVRASTVPRLPRRLSYRAAGERSAAADTVPNQDPIRDQRDWDRNRAAPARTVCVQTATRSGTSRHARADSHCAAAPSHLDWAQYPGGEPGQGWRAGRRDSRVRARRCVSERGSRFDWLCPCLADVIVTRILAGPLRSATRSGIPERVDAVAQGRPFALWQLPAVQHRVVAQVEDDLAAAKDEAGSTPAW